ncbi:acyl carrier protein [Nonomuraea sp. NPDC046570]|uniref:acyl carrier protein n=1 Tax=Nonomuraea sp. NPDC046570 TaxID=3155255 RepID=UPI0033DAC79F
MQELTIDTLKEFLLKAVGEDESIDLSGDIMDVELGELGFDSLAIIDTTAKIERHFGIKLPDLEIRTPRDFLTTVNAQFTGA